MAKTNKFSAGLIVVRGEAAQRQFLLVRSFRNWDFPKGEVEPGEPPLAAAKRETWEETSLREIDFPWGEQFCDTAPYSGGKVARYFLSRWVAGAVSLPIAPELGRPENDEFRWVNYAAAGRLLPPRLTPIIDWAQAILSAY